MKTKQKKQLRLFFLMFTLFLFAQFMFLNKYQREPYPAILLPGGGPPQKYQDTLHYVRHEFKVFTQKDSVLIPAFEIFDNLPKQYVEPTAYFLDSSPSLLKKEKIIFNKVLKIGSLEFIFKLSFRKDKHQAQHFQKWLKSKIKSKLNKSIDSVFLSKIGYKYVLKDKTKYQEELSKLKIIPTLGNFNEKNR